MNCPNCGNVVAVRKNRCEMCGKDLTTYKRVYLVSNLYYNQGLDKARVRDLSGAIVMLKKSLEMNKRNTNARNLLGLIFFEMGETVAALSEWVISKHFQSNDNDADLYMGKIQENPTKLDNINQSIKKYNIALESAKQDSDDLAIIQLKKVISLNPHFLHALQLLALLYMKNNEFERAKKTLARASQIDLSNTITLHYINELKAMQTGITSGKIPYWSDGSVEEGGKNYIAPVSSYREDKPNILAFVNLIVGVLIGIAVVFILIVPTVKENIRKEYEKDELNFSSQLNIQLATIHSNEKEIESLNTKLDETKRALEQARENATDTTTYDVLLAAIHQYVKQQTADENGSSNLLELADGISSIVPESLKNTDAVAIYEQMKEVIYPLAWEEEYTKGRSYYDTKEYEKAKEALQKAYLYQPTDDNTMYYLGKTYQDAGDKEQAIVYYTELVEKRPDSSLVKYAKQRLNQLKN